jgi:hypothetical protein
LHLDGSGGVLSSINTPHITLTNIIVFNASCALHGGAFSMISTQPESLITCTMKDVTFDVVKAGGSGGAAYILGANATLTNINVSNSTADSDGGALAMIS